MAAGVYDLVLEKGTDIDVTFNWGTGTNPFVPNNVTGYTARMQWRVTADAVAILAEFTTANGKLVVDGPAGKFTLVVSATESAGWGFTEAVYDLEIIAPGPPTKVKRLLKGTVTIDPEVTR